VGARRECDALVPTGECSCDGVFAGQVVGVQGQWTTRRYARE